MLMARLDQLAESDRLDMSLLCLVVLSAPEALNSRQIHALDENLIGV